MSFSGDVSETITFNSDSRWIAQNFTAVANWLPSLGDPEGGGQKTGGYMWKGVGVEQVVAFLSSYSSHEDALRANTALLSRYIKVPSESGELLDWTVRLVSSGERTPHSRRSMACRLALSRGLNIPRSLGLGDTRSGG